MAWLSTKVVGTEHHLLHQQRAPQAWSKSSIGQHQVGKGGASSQPLDVKDGVL